MIKCVQNVFSNRSRWEAYNAALKGGVAPLAGKGRKKGGERPEDGIGDQDPPSFKTDRRLWCVLSNIYTSVLLKMHLVRSHGRKMQTVNDIQVSDIPQKPHKDSGYNSDK